MASESVQILIEAEDKASAKIASATQAIDQNIKSVKDTGAKAKASTEFLGVLAGQLGGTELASYAGQLAGVTEKVGQFAEMQKVGGAGALLFKAGLVSLVAALAVNIGQSLGNIIFQTDKWNKKLEEARQQIRELAQATARVQNLRFSQDMEEIELIRDPDEQQQVAHEYFTNVSNDLKTVEVSLARNISKLDKMKKAWNITGEAKANIKIKQDEIDLEREKVAQLVDQQNQLSNVYGKRALAIKAFKEETAAIEKKKQLDADSLSQIKALRFEYDELTIGSLEAKRAQALSAGASEQDAQIMLNLQKMIDMEREKADAKKKADEEEKARIQKIDDLRKSELERLQEQKIAIEQGEQAAHAFRLQQQGLDKGTAEAIAAAQAAMDASKEKKDSKPIEQTSNAAFESRLLSRGPREDDQKKIVENTKLTVEQLGKVEEAIKKLETSKTDPKSNLKIEVIK